MSRRMLDSSVWDDEDFATLPPLTRLLFIGLLCHVDQYGCMTARSGFLRSKIFPLDDIDLKVIEEGLSQLAAKQMIRCDEQGSKARLQITKWFDSPNGYVYLAHNGELHKIGFSGDPGRRMSQIKRDTGSSCRILFVFQTPDYRSLESELHEHFDHKRVTGEWFDLNDEDVAWIKSLMARRSKESQ
jgi:hypothetical protein